MKSIIKEIRLSEDIAFFEWENETVEYINETFIKTKKIIDRNITLSDDKLTKTITLEFRSMDDAVEFTDDAVLCQARSKKLKYDIENKIRTLRS
jgi:hypothetical protein